MLTLDGETGMRAKEADEWAMFNQVSPKYKAPHQTIWTVERPNALIRSALQRCESQVLKESLVASFATVLGLATFMHNAWTSTNNHTPYQALLGRQPHLLPPLEGGYYGDLGVKGQDDFARVREIAAVAIIQAIVQQRFQRGGKRNQVVAQERADHSPGDLLDPPNKDIPGWRRPAKIASVNFGEGNVTVRFQGGTLDRRYQEVRMHVPYSVYLPSLVDPTRDEWSVVKREVESFISTSIIVAIVVQEVSCSSACDCRH